MPLPRRQAGGQAVATRRSAHKLHFGLKQFAPSLAKWTLAHSYDTYTDQRKINVNNLQIHEFIFVLLNPSIIIIVSVIKIL